MEIINLSNRKEVEVNINGNECIVSLSLKNINHFQESTKIGLPKALDKMNGIKCNFNNIVTNIKELN